VTRPCVLARRLDAARRILAEAGVTVLSVTQTSPPKGPDSGPLRVVRAREEAEGVHLLVAAETAPAEAYDPNN
jgi:hypothetical protein